MKIETLELILDTAIMCIKGHTGIEDNNDTEVVNEAQRLGGYLNSRNRKVSQMSVSTTLKGKVNENSHRH